MATEKTGTAVGSPATGENAAAAGGQGASAKTSLAAAEGMERYTPAEFIQAAEKLFPDRKSRPSAYLIDAAFKVKGVEAATKEEGIRIIKDFMGRKVE